jgi:hypothetical protein
MLTPVLDNLALGVIAKSEADEAIKFLFLVVLDCFASLAMTWFDQEFGQTCRN